MFKVYTYQEIDRLPHEGWFYGFARDRDGRLLFGEVFPGFGIAAGFPYPWWNPVTWVHVFKDVFFYQPGS